MESPFALRLFVTQGKARLKSTLPAQMPGAWAQIVVEINGVKTNCAPQHGWRANSSFAGVANRASSEVIRVCRKLQRESNSKNLWKSFAQVA
jgi:hypothetical protein